MLERKIKNFDRLQATGNESKPFNIKKAIDYVAKAWDSVSSITITKCWEKTGIICFKDNESFNNTVVNDVASQQEAVQNLIDRLSIDSALSATEYISIDEKVINNDMVTDEEIVSLFSPTEEEDDNESNSPCLPAVLTKDAITAFETAFNFLQQGSMEIDYNELKVFRSLKRKVELHSVTSKKQSRIDSFSTD